jgi:fructose-1-phosphate kinase PfkB-like protein
MAGQAMWNNLKKKDCIPSIYLPNTREIEQTTRKSIEALDDCIAYVTSKYDVCYEEIF